MVTQSKYHCHAVLHKQFMIIFFNLALYRNNAAMVYLSNLT